MTARILVIDDEMAIRDLLREILALAGYDVTVAGDGDSAMVLLRRQPVDLIITDIFMPGKDGAVRTIFTPFHEDEILQVVRETLAT